MKIYTAKVLLETKRQFEIVDVTAQVRQHLAQSGIQKGILTLLVPHTTAAIRLNQNEPLLLQDAMKLLYRLVPTDVNYSHDVFEMRKQVSANERTNGHAHLKAFLLGSSESIIVEDHDIKLGEKQSVLFLDFDGGRSRDFNLHIIGE